MSCVLRIAGRKLDVDDFIKRSGLKGFVKRPRKPGITRKSELRLQYSFVAGTVSKGGMDNLNKQVRETIAYLKKHKKKLSLINQTKEVEHATLDFMIVVKSVSKNYFAQYLLFPKELTALSGSLGISIEVSLV